MFSQSIDETLVRVTVHNTACCFDRKLEENSGILTDLSKAFNCIPHDLFFAKLEAYAEADLGLLQHPRWSAL